METVPLGTTFILDLNSIVNQKFHPDYILKYVNCVNCIETLENQHCELPWPHGPPQRVT